MLRWGVLLDEALFDPHILVMRKRAGASQGRIRHNIPLIPVRSTSIAAAGYASKVCI